MDERSINLRRMVLETMACAGRGHLASALSIIEILRVLYDDILRHDPRLPSWPMRDRFILSKGHGCLALYAILADKGYFPAAELARFCAGDGLLGGHPEHGTPGVEASTGSLGHGLPIALGRALAGRIDGAAYRCFVLLGDGECDEGSVWEAAMAAGKHGVDSLTVLVDYNKMQSYGPVAAVQGLEPFAAKWESFGWAVAATDGHDVAALRELCRRLPLTGGRPSAIICNTVKGKGIPMVENDLAWHHKSGLKETEIARLREGLGGGSAHA